MKKYSRFPILIISAILWKILCFMSLKSELIYMYSFHDFYLKSINCIKIINRERWTKRCLGKSICKSQWIFSLSITNIVLVRVQKVIPRIIEIKKLISNRLKQVWTCICISSNAWSFYLRPFYSFSLIIGFGGAMVSMLNCCAQDRGFKPGRSLRIFYER